MTLPAFKETNRETRCIAVEPRYVVQLCTIYQINENPLYVGHLDNRYIVSISEAALVIKF